MVESFYPLHVRICGECLLVQLPAYVAGEDIFSDYLYFSSYSTPGSNTPGATPTQMTDQLGLGPDSLVTEVASNDGYLLQHFVAAGVPVLGVEPAANIAEVARGRASGPRSRSSGRRPARTSPAQYGRADLVAGNNVFAHVPDIVDFSAGLAALVKPTGLVTLEFPHLLRLIESRQFDTIYHEHYQYLSLLTASRALATAGLAVVDVDELSTHGGSLRVHARHADAAGEPSVRVKERPRRGGRRRAAHARRTRGLRRRGLPRSSATWSTSSSRRGPRASGWSATAPRARETRCSTIAESGLTCWPTRSTAPRTSRAGTCRARTSRSTLRSASPWIGPTTCWCCRGISGPRSAEQLSYIRDWGGRLVFPIPRSRWCGR